MPEQARNAFVAAAIVIVIMAILPPAMLGRHSDWFPTFLKEYQTLFTGFLAVAAAIGTILRMQADDTRQENRHRQLVELSERGDRRRIERAMHPQIDDLRSVLTSLVAIELDESRRGETKGDPHWRLLSDVANPYRSLLIKLEDIFTRSQFQDAEPLFDGRLTWSMNQLMAAILTAKGNIETHLEANGPHMPSWYRDYEFDFDENKEEIFVRLRIIPILLGKVLAELERIDRSNIST